MLINPFVVGLQIKILNFAIIVLHGPSSIWSLISIQLYIITKYFSLNNQYIYIKYISNKSYDLITIISLDLLKY
jgi:hypothetical protein